MKRNATKIPAAAWPCALVVGMLSPFTWAQNATTAQPDVLQEIVITAERRSEDVSTIPIAMTAISGQQLSDQHVNTIEELVALAPGLTINGLTGGFETINIRGIGNSSQNPSVTTGAVVIRDGLPDIETNAQGEPFYDLADTDVLRGPQGTFVGASSTGGALLINSVNPSLAAESGYLELQIGDYTDRKVDGAFNMPIGDTFAARLAFNVEQRHSFFYDQGALVTGPASDPVIDPGKVENTNFRLGLLWKPNESFQALLKIEANHSSTDGLPAQINQNSFPDPLTGAPVHVPYYQYSSHSPFVLNYESTALLDKQDVDRYGLELRYTLPDGIVLRSQSGFQTHNFPDVSEISLTSLNAGIKYQDVGPHDYNYYQELNIISPDAGRLTWIAGVASFYRQTPINNSTNQLTLTPPVPALALQIRATTRSDGVFGQVSYQVLDSLQLQLGARENWDSNFNGGTIFVHLPGPGAPVINVPNVGYYSDNTPTAKVGINWRPSATEYVYAFAARGYKSGGTNVATGAPFDVEHVDDYEFGLKSKLFDGKVQTQIGAYYMNYKNMQEDIYNAYAGFMDEIVNLGNSTIKGIEASAQGRVGGLGVVAGITYNQSKLGAVNNPAALVAGGVVATYKLPLAVQQNPNGNPQCVAGETTGCFNYAPYTEALAGEQNPFSPKWAANLTLDYGFAVGANVLRPQVSISHTGQEYASLFQQDHFFLIPARDIVNAALTYEAGQWRAQAYVTNLADKVYVSGYSIPDGNQEYYGAPRQMGVRISKRF